MLICCLDVVVEWCMLFVDIILLHWNTNLLMNAQFFTGCHYNEEKISRDLKRKEKKNKTDTKTKQNKPLVFGHIESVKILVILHRAGYMLTSSGFT